MGYHNLSRRKTGSLSNAYWLLPSIMVFRCSFLIRTRAGTEYSNIGVHGAVNIAATGIIIFVLLFKWHNVRVALRDSGVEVKLIIAYYFFAVLSGIWSTSLAYSSYRATEFLAHFMIVLLLMHNIGDFLKAERFVLMASCIVLMMQTVGFNIYAGWGSFGINTTTVMPGLLLAYAFGELETATSERKRLLWLSSILSVTVLALSRSTGSNIAAMLTFSLLVLSPSHWKYIILVPLGYLLIINLPIIPEKLLAGDTLEDIVSLKHRSGIWESSWELFLQRPFLGYGFGGIATRHNLSVGSAHNNILEILLDCGIAGITLMLVTYITLFTRMFRRFIKHKRGAIGCFLALIFFFINNLSAPVFGTIWGTSNTVFALLLGLFTYYVAPSNRLGTID